MPAKIITATVFLIAFIASLYYSFNSIRNHDDAMAVICSLGASLFGLILGILLGSLLF